MSDLPDPAKDVSDPLSYGSGNDGPKVIDRNNPFGESAAAAAARKRRNIVLAVGLIVFALLVFVVTMSKLKGDALVGGHL